MKVTTQYVANCTYTNKFYTQFYMQVNIFNTLRRGEYLRLSMTDRFNMFSDPHETHNLNYI